MQPPPADLCRWAISASSHPPGSSQRPPTEGPGTDFCLRHLAHTELVAAPVFDAANERNPSQPESPGRLRQPLLVLRDSLRPWSKPFHETRPDLQEVNTLVRSGYRELVISDQSGQMGTGSGTRHQVSGPTT